MYYEITEARAHRFAEVVRDAGYETSVTHFVHAKAAATLAGLGWIGKQTLCITPELGPHVRWVCVVTNAVLPTTSPSPWTCAATASCCVKACPTQAIIPGPSQGVEPGKKVDFWKCIVPQEMLAEPNKRLGEVGRALLAARQPRVPRSASTPALSEGKNTNAASGAYSTRPTG